MLTFELSSSAIEVDSRDPHFMSNLSRLGVVKVDHHMKAVRPVRFFTQFIVEYLPNIMFSTRDLGT